MSSRPETSRSTLGRLQADLEGVAQLFAAGSSALPRLAMGSDPEGLVHVGVDARGQVVRLELDPSWREALAPDSLSLAVDGALQQAVGVRTGDWAAAVATAAPSRARREPGAELDPRRRHESGDQPARLALDPASVTSLDDRALEVALMAAMSANRRASPAASSVRPRDLHELESRTHATLLDRAADLPPFMRGTLELSLDRVHDGVGQALTLPLASEAAAREPLRAFAAGLEESLWLVGRPAGLPAAAELWTTAALGLTSGLADTRRSRGSRLTRWGRRDRAAS